MFNGALLVPRLTGDAGLEPERVCGEGAGWRWINRMRDGLREETIDVNAEGGLARINVGDDCGLG